MTPRALSRGRGGTAGRRDRDDHAWLARGVDRRATAPRRSLTKPTSYKSVGGFTRSPRLSQPAGCSHGGSVPRLGAGLTPDDARRYRPRVELRRVRPVVMPPDLLASGVAPPDRTGDARPPRAEPTRANPQEGRTPRAHLRVAEELLEELRRRGPAPKAGAPDHG